MVVCEIHVEGRMGKPYQFYAFLFHYKHLCDYTSVAFSN
jgi:hypothetical protein